MNQFQEFIHNSETDFETEIVSTIQESLEEGNLSLQSFTKYHDEIFTLLYYKNDELVFWSDRSFVPENVINKLSNQNQTFIPFADDNYYVMSHDLDSTQHLFYIRPMYRDDRAKMKSLFHKGQLFSIDNEITSSIYLPISNISEQTIGYLNKLPKKQSNIFEEICWILFMFFFILGAYRFVKNLPQSVSGITKALILLIIFTGFKSIVRIDPLGVFAQFSIFQQNIYANSFFGESLGMLMLNIILLAFVILIWNIYPFTPKILGRSPIISFFSFQGLFVGSYILLSLLMRSLVRDSSEILEVRPSLSTYSILDILVIFLVFTFYAMLNIRAIRFIISKYNINYQITMLFGSIVLIGVSCSLLFPTNVSIFLTSWYILFAVVLFFLLSNDEILINKMSGFVIIIFLYSIYAALIIQTYNTKKIDDQLKQIARQVSLKNDDIAEYLLENLLQDIVNDVSILNTLKSPFVSDNTIFNRINNVYIENELQDYQINYKLLPLSDTTGLKPLIGAGNFYDRFNYNLIIPYKNLNNPLMLEIDFVKSKTSLGNDFYSRYSNKNRSSVIDDTDISYAIYEEDTLQYMKGNAFLTDLSMIAGMEVGQTATINIKNQTQLIYKYNPTDFVLLEANRLQSRRQFLYLVSNFFAALFFGFILLVLFSTRFNLSNATFFSTSFSNQIQFVVLSVLFFAVFIVALFSLLSVKNEIKRLHTNEYQNQLDQLVNKFLQEAEFMNEYEFRNRFINYLSDRYQQADFDLHYFSSQGDLLFSNNPLLFKDRVWPTKVSPVALEAFYEYPYQNRNLQEFVLSHEYTGFYKVIRDKQFNIMGLLYLPAFDINQEISQQEEIVSYSQFNTFSIVLFLLTIVSLFLTQSLTNILTNIRNRLSKVDLGTHHNLIEWKANDEIGLLVNEYNQMVQKLDESAVLLARSERESAWRDVAKQVAHEIKNPLTPMKLSIQHLKRRVKQEDPENTKEAVLKTLDTLNAQMEHLANIADGFSTVAKMDLPEYELINLADALKGFIPMYNNHEHFTFEFINSTLKDEALVYADSTMINRLVNNLLRNAEQALSENKHGLIILELLETEDNYIIEVKDNGKGISPMERAKIFTPNFTTKTTGTGIGLFMSKKIVDLHKGVINFTSNPNEGTTFHVSIPKYKKD